MRSAPGNAGLNAAQAADSLCYLQKKPLETAAL
jgi:hypothetical protein